MTGQAAASVVRVGLHALVPGRPRAIGEDTEHRLQPVVDQGPEKSAPSIGADHSAFVDSSLQKHPMLRCNSALLLQEDAPQFEDLRPVVIRAELSQDRRRGRIPGGTDAIRGHHLGDIRLQSGNGRQIDIPHPTIDPVDAQSDVPGLGEVGLEHADPALEMGAAGRRNQQKIPPVEERIEGRPHHQVVAPVEDG